jgi:hypothetical protein
MRSASFGGTIARVAGVAGVAARGRVAGDRARVRSPPRIAAVARARGRATRGRATRALDDGCERVDDVRRRARWTRGVNRRAGPTAARAIAPRRRRAGRRRRRRAPAMDGVDGAG